jgi:hypothetical protein
MVCVFYGFCLLCIIILRPHYILVRVTYRIYNFYNLKFDLWFGLCVPFIASRMENQNGHVEKEHNARELIT